MLKVDYHMHTDFSPDSTANPHAMVGRAIELGMKSICITDHYEGRGQGKNLRPTLNNDQYISKLLELKEFYKNRIDVKVGAEFSLDLRHRELFKELVNNYPMDFVIGSNHKTPGSDEWSVSKADSYSDKQWYTDALTETVELIKEIKEFDVLGHVDYIVRYGTYQTRDYIISDYKEILEEIFKILIYDGKGIEINAAGFKYGLGFAHPHVDALKMYRQLGGEIITIGSDAHAPEHIGYNYPGVREQLLDAGFKYYTEFSNRKAIFSELV